MELEDEGLLQITRPVHGQTGIWRAQEYWSVEVTEAGIDLVEANQEYQPPQAARETTMKRTVKLTNAFHGTEATAQVYDGADITDYASVQAELTAAQRESLRRRLCPHGKACKCSGAVKVVQ